MFSHKTASLLLSTLCSSSAGRGGCVRCLMHHKQQFYFHLDWILAPLFSCLWAVSVTGGWDEVTRPLSLHPLVFCGSRRGCKQVRGAERGNYSQTFYIGLNGRGPWLIHRVAERFPLLRGPSDSENPSASEVSPVPLWVRSRWAHRSRRSFRGKMVLAESWGERRSLVFGAYLRIKTKKQSVLM